MTSLDDSVGKIFQSLKEKDFLSKSIIILTSDNGGSLTAGSNWPLRGQKGSGWEGGVRSPTLVWSPLLKLKEPRISSQLMHITDWLPTFYRLSGELLPFHVASLQKHLRMNSSFLTYLIIYVIVEEKYNKNVLGTKVKVVC